MRLCAQSSTMAVEIQVPTNHEPISAATCRATFPHHCQQPRRVHLMRAVARNTTVPAQDATEPSLHSEEPPRSKPQSPPSNTSTKSPASISSDPSQHYTKHHPNRPHKSTGPQFTATAIPPPVSTHSLPTPHSHPPTVHTRPSALRRGGPTMVCRMHRPTQRR